MAGIAAALGPIACVTAATNKGEGEAGQPVAIRNVSVFDSNEGTILPRQTVVIEDERIRAVSPAARIPRCAQVIDGRGQYLIPGLIDAHVHLVHLSEETNVRGDGTLPMFLGAGVTSVRSTGDAIVAQKIIDRYAERHPKICPRVYMASPLIDGNPPFHKHVGLAVTDPNEVPKLVEDLKRCGVVTLKIYEGISPEVGRKVIEEGHRQGLVITGHLRTYPALQAVEEGIDCLEHIWGIFNFILEGKNPADVDLSNPTAQHLIVAVKQRKVFVDPTLVYTRNGHLLYDRPEYNQHPDNARAPERMRTQWLRVLQQGGFPRKEPLDIRRKEFRKYQELTGILHRAGIPILAGTDAPQHFVPPGFSLHQELELLVESGLSPAAALTSATLQNARILKQAELLGSVQEGKLADLVLLRSNPISDIRNTRSISKVIRGGRVLDPRTILKAVPVT